ncbi:MULTISPECIES: bifunctional riboflavin kinase/FAD synthetase [unclassified Coleofasciculus]|uniref:bifunctional riboflavin kinase/FAD synthetase n=1 Tax=unclassified Coleofasciculus TaxID=2692782 RepID=UPI001880D968|nr:MULTISPECIES: bifunctional riboflavin kinase/FAD synthetase [unclassified Coleofasciculus]MBE9128920.1 bifunctional riboflavin kinase/FAD synthetase [Coleofasciculus sp. LEGE 07081]MBE9150388.1 bifunctional riboflavin kinase/FAD synthetase [Coleofasciculus sp. LEGE 07092]
MWVTSSSTAALTPTAVALGNFDGVHRGHQQVIQPILQESQTSTVGGEPSQYEDLRLPSSQTTVQNQVERGREHIYATMATFYPHPREFFSGQKWKLLTPRSEKVQQLKLLGIEQLVLLPFDWELASLSPEQFVEKILVQQLQVTHVSVGEDFRFGNRRVGTSQDLQAIASTYGVDVTIVPLQMSLGERISSSLIRKSLEQGDMAKANQLLGRSYSITGVVVKGQRLGATLGFPTANLQLPPDKFLPRQGVYCVRVYNPLLPPSTLGVMNIGIRPTVDGSSLTVEVHLLDWTEDLYGQVLTVSLEQFLRPEQKFASLESLKAQIQTDCAAARAFFEHKG